MEALAALALLIVRMIEQPENTDRYFAPFLQFLFPLTILVSTRYAHKMASVLLKCHKIDVGDRKLCDTRGIGIC